MTSGASVEDGFPSSVRCGQVRGEGEVDAPAGHFGQWARWGQQRRWRGADGAFTRESRAGG